MKLNWQKILLSGVSLTKIFLWLLTLEFTLASLTCWTTSSLLVICVLPERGIIMPGFTHFVLFPNWWILFCPLPWLVYATVLSRRQALSRRAALVFAGTIIVATILLVFTVVTACFLPFRALTCCMSEP